MMVTRIIILDIPCGSLYIFGMKAVIGIRYLALLMRRGCIIGIQKETIYIMWTLRLMLHAFQAKESMKLYIKAKNFLCPLLPAQPPYGPSLLATPLTTPPRRPPLQYPQAPRTIRKPRSSRYRGRFLVTDGGDPDPQELDSTQQDPEDKENIPPTSTPTPSPPTPPTPPTSRPPLDHLLLQRLEEEIRQLQESLQEDLEEEFGNLYLRLGIRQ
ncbi:E4 [Oryctolagus cuniculus papillomavirus 1]|uniref:E4 n=2 Tax=Kappapapillomavirus TaxID=325457 RepID=Q9J027_9PAPI|nr:E4 [Oryctolagus cuniculus papillomavirus 1]AAF67126.1 E4 [Oryctolagus cuniculus papillomavirus 1]